ncbi:MAG: hypothetical protein HXX13_11340 [Bacteroidetes bacterium]|nr:hypothetical protein [Bacteroidota bacterium]
MKLVYSILITAAMLVRLSAFAQDATEEPTGPDNRPAKPAFESGLLFDQQTSNVQQKNALEFVIQHRFGSVEYGLKKDLYGLWGSSNIRIGLNYTILKNLMVGWGATKIKKAQDFQLKYNIVEQTRSNSIPVTLTLYTDMQIDCALPKDDTLAVGTNFKFSNRFSYFTELIISRRFNNHLSMQLAPSFTHYNWYKVDTVNIKSADAYWLPFSTTDVSAWEHDKIGISYAVRYKISPQTSFMFGVDWPLKIKGIAEYKEFINPPKPNFTIGAEISTSTHAFHIFFGTSQSILPQETMMNNQNDFFNKQFLLGLNITRLWNF